MRIIIDMEVPDDHRSLFRVLIGDKLIAETLTSAQSHLLVGDILERLVLRGAPECSLPPPPFFQTSAADSFEASPRLRRIDAVHPIWRAFAAAGHRIKFIASCETLGKASSRLSSCWRSGRQTWRTLVGNPLRWLVDWAATFANRRAQWSVFELFLDRRRGFPKVSLPLPAASLRVRVRYENRRPPSGRQPLHQSQRSYPR